MRGKRTYGTYRGKRQRATSLLVLLALCVLAVPALGAPAAPVIGAPAQNAFVAGPVFSISGTSAGDVTLVRILEGATVRGETAPTNGFWTVSISLPDGSHTITAMGRDSAGVWGASSAPRTFVVDAINPGAPSITAPADGLLVGFSLITVEGTTEPYGRVKVYDDGSLVMTAIASSTGAWSAARDFEDRTHALTATATDRAGNTGLASPPSHVTVDTTPPARPSIEIPARDGSVGSTTVTISGIGEPGSTVKVFEGTTILMTAPVSDGSWAGDVLFGVGAHTISARAFDAIGNASPPSAEVTFTVDLTPPVAPTFTTPLPGSYVASPVTIAGATEPYAHVELRAGSLTVRTTYADRYGAFTFTLDLPSGTYTYTARATDRAGNVGPSSAALTFTADAGVPQIRLETPNGTIFLPGQFPLIRGFAFDEIGVDRIRLDYYNLIGKLAYRQVVTCWGCPGGVDVEWRADMEPPIGRYEVYAYAIDRVGHESLPAKAIIIKL
jgi:large repetitive protein